MSSNLLSSSLSVYGSRNDKLTEKYLELGQLYDKRLWHQLTEGLESFIADESFWVDRNMLDLYKDFVEKFENKLNPLRLVLFAKKASRQHFTGEAFEPASPNELMLALEFMQHVASKPFLGDEGRMVAKLCICEYMIGLNKDAEAKALLDEVSPKLVLLEGSVAEADVKSNYYLAESSYYKKVGPAGAFYTSVMQYLAHTPFESLPRAKRLLLALDVVLAALVADDVFNFGDVLRYEVVQELGTSPNHKWLLDLLVVFNDGNVQGFNALVDGHRKAFESSPTLIANVETLKQKVALLSLVRVVFDRPPQERDIHFRDITSAAFLPIDQVEWLVMRAFSKKLLRGTIDEIEQTVHVTWLMPRILDAAQTKILDDKIVAWAKNVDQALLFEMQSPELFSFT